MYTQTLKSLINELKKENIYSVVDSVCEHMNGYIVKFKDESDVAIHEYTYGHEDMLWESYQMPQDCGDVTGWLTSKEIIQRLKENFNL